MGKKTKIDWCDSTWNPVTGCLHGCEYCYARRIAERFGGYPTDTQIHELECAQIVSHRNDEGEWNREYKCAYPFSFSPTLHRYRLDEPARWTKPRTIFVCSMADLFGDWVPDKWIQEVISACLAAPHHRYLFLTKNPTRYMQLIDKGIIPENQPNFWLGSTTTTPETAFFFCDRANTFVSIEPILAPFTDLTDDDRKPESFVDWIIVGAETGRRKNKVVPEKSWITELVECARECHVPVFMKESLRGIMGDDFVQEFPWEV